LRVGFIRICLFENKRKKKKERRKEIWKEIGVK
jgi:hypothetical protein